MAISIDDIKKLRAMTGAGLADVKKALTEAEGDFDRAKELLRERGLAIAAKRSDRETSNGCVLTKKVGDFAAIIALKCETDFVANGADFIALTENILNAAIAANARTLSSAYKEVAERIIEERYDPPTFGMDLLKKDNKLCLDMANDAGAPLVIGNAIDYVNRMASSQGYGKLDHAVAWKPIYDNWQKK